MVAGGSSPVWSERSGHRPLTGRGWSLERHLLEGLLSPTLRLIRVAVVAHAEDPAVLAPPEHRELGRGPVGPVLEAGLGERLAALLAVERVEIGTAARAAAAARAADDVHAVRVAAAVRPVGPIGAVGPGPVVGLAAVPKASRRLLLPEIERHADQRGTL